ncbi:tRNA guanosine-2'-O-methyltransferase [Neosynechococcus sphagnicola sy1]|uniref:tRNA guanosine-2'-O-methyltransferase n=2 Tax=Neosynechococcus TaxID=1501143 RepID=A0A098TIH4_9CYAN|nr:tRNA guanosine-2'-O-methyltransferase [Neosynechococcus sphagnicola sy1]
MPRRNLIICATLVQNPANLGGLCRTAEAFRLAALVTGDASMTQRAAFRDLAVSAHRWQPLHICTPLELPEWILTQQQSGYRAIALEAHPRAVPLPEFRFPQSTVLILGRELTGIPPEILDQCDQSVVIPQAGMVESLNVQTAAAIAIYEYSKQHPLPHDRPLE